MVPAGLTIGAIFADAADVVTEFAPLVLLVVGLSVGVWGVKFIMNTVRKARG